MATRRRVSSAWGGRRYHGHPATQEHTTRQHSQLVGHLGKRRRRAKRRSCGRARGCCSRRGLQRRRRRCCKPLQVGLFQRLGKPLGEPVGLRRGEFAEGRRGVLEEWRRHMPHLISSPSTSVLISSPSPSVLMRHMPHFILSPSPSVLLSDPLTTWTRRFRPAPRWGCLLWIVKRRGSSLSMSTPSAFVPRSHCSLTRGRRCRRCALRIEA